MDRGNFRDSRKKRGVKREPSGVVLWGRGGGYCGGGFSLAVLCIFYSDLPRILRLRLTKAEALCSSDGFFLLSILKRLETALQGKQKRIEKRQKLACFL